MTSAKKKKTIDQSLWDFRRVELGLLAEATVLLCDYFRASTNLFNEKRDSTASKREEGISTDEEAKRSNLGTARRQFIETCLGALKRFHGVTDNNKDEWRMNVAYPYFTTAEDVIRLCYKQTRAENKKRKKKGQQPEKVELKASKSALEKTLGLSVPKVFIVAASKRNGPKEQALYLVANLFNLGTTNFSDYIERVEEAQGSLAEIKKGHSLREPNKLRNDALLEMRSQGLFASYTPGARRRAYRSVSALVDCIGLDAKDVFWSSVKRAFPMRFARKDASGRNYAFEVVEELVVSLGLDCDDLEWAVQAMKKREGTYNNVAKPKEIIDPACAVFGLHSDSQVKELNYREDERVSDVLRRRVMKMEGE